MEMVCVGSVHDLPAFITACQFPLNALFLGEIHPRRTISHDERQGLLRFAHFDTSIAFADYTTGRIFHPNFELRWEQTSASTAMYQVVYIGAERDMSNLRCNDYLIECKEHAENEHKKQGDKYQCIFLNETHYYLFGTIVKDATKKAVERERTVVFAEARIPRPLHYPDLSSPAERVQLQVREYCDRQSGQVMWFRFADLKAAEEEQA